MQRYKIFIPFLWLLLCLPARAQMPVWPEELAADVQFLCDSVCAGRSMGTAGANRAAFYILGRFRAAGYDTAVESFAAAGRRGRNLLAFPKGFNPKEPFILVISYYDGLGEIEGRLFPGADSNASGVAALLALADVMHDVPTVSGRKIAFAAVDGHCCGMEGSRLLASHYKPYMVVNLDTMGSTLVPPTRGIHNYLIALGARLYANTLEQADVFGEMHFYYDYYRSDRFTELFYKRISDHKWWLGRRVPCIFFTSGITLNTNREADTPDTLDYDIFAARVDIIARWLRGR